MAEPVRVEFPTFELAGPPCEVPGCSGVLVDHISLKSKDFFRKCATCGTEFHRVPGIEKLAWAKRVIGRILRGEKED